MGNSVCGQSNVRTPRYRPFSLQSWLLLSLLCMGCLKESSSVDKYSGEEATAESRDHFDALESRPETTQVSLSQDPASPGDAAQGNVTQRKLIYEAELRVVVDNFDQIERDILVLIETAGGYQADISIDRQRRRRRSGRWVARIPVSRYQEFLIEIQSLGVPEHLRQTAVDVSEEYVDLESRLRNKRRLEERILELLKANTGKISDIVIVERQLSEVRSAIEQMEGRKRYLENRTAFATVNIQIQERIDYTPPQQPGLGIRLWHSAQSSLRSIFDASVMVMIGVAALIPWLIVLVPVITITYLMFRRWRSESK